MSDLQPIVADYEDTSDVPKGDDVYYRCTACGGVIPSVPNDNLGCVCGNVYIDRDWWRLVVADFGGFEVLRTRS